MGNFANWVFSRKILISDQKHFDQFYFYTTDKIVQQIIGVGKRKTKINYVLEVEYQTI